LVQGESVTRVRARNVVLAAGWAALAACSSDATGPNTASIESVTITPATATVAVGANFALNAEVRDAAGNVIPDLRIAWASEDPSIAEVSTSGVVTGRTIGTVLIAASARGRDAFASVTVNPTPIGTIRVSAEHRSMLVGESVQLTAQALDSRGNVLSGRPITWSTSDASIASVTESGLVTAIAPGGTIITARAEGNSAVASITVAQVPVASVRVQPVDVDLVVGQTTELSAQLLDASGGQITGRPITWSTNRPGVATVTSDGLVTAIASGNATITATREGRSATTNVDVSPRPASAVIVSPSTVSIFRNQTVQLSALVTDDRGLVLSGRPVSFSSDNAQVATVSSAGLVTTIAAGAATITATSEGATGSATITVLPDPVAFVEVSPSPTSVIVGRTVQLTAAPRNATGQQLAGRNVSWTSGSPALATVSSSGLVTGIAPGNAVIVATVDGRQGSAQVNVRPVPVASVTVSPSTASTTVGQNVTLSASTLDASGGILTGRVVGWTSSDNTVATVSGNGVVTGAGSGTVTITAISEGQSGIATVTVGQVPVASVVVTPAQAGLTVGQTQQLSAQPNDDSGQPLAGRPVTWSTSSASVATVSATGTVTGVAAGTATITATSEGQSGTATVTVTNPGPGPIASISVSPSSGTLNVGQSATLTATARDAGGTIVPASITWSSSSSSVATVSSGGVVTGVAAGTATITASSGTVTGTATITVQLAPVARIVITPPNPEVEEDETIQLTATLYDAQNNVLTGRSVTWSSSNTSLATVSSTGLVRGRREGTVTITATSEGVSGSTKVEIDDD
jgi:uncharacterized protein YjdB